MGANTYRLMSGFSAEAETLEAVEAAAVDELARTPKVVFSSTLQPPLAWANTQLVGGDAVEAVAAVKEDGASPMRTHRRLRPGRMLLRAGPGRPFPPGGLPPDHRKNRRRPDL